MSNTYLFDWGDTLMVDFPNTPGKMCDWEKVEAVEGAKEALKYLFYNNKIYIATSATESTELEIKKAFERVDLAQYISGYFCKANIGFSKGSPEFLQTILFKLNANKKNVIMVGDSFEKDIKPAINIGLKSIWLTKLQNKSGIKDTKVISSLYQLFNNKTDIN